MRDLMLRRLRALLRRHDLDREMDDEMKFHVEMEAAELERFGVEPGEALRAIGVIAGVLVALPVTRTLGGLLYGVSTRDPMVFGGVVLLLAGVALIATALPAVRAMRVEPMRALRLE